MLDNYNLDQVTCILTHTLGVQKFRCKVHLVLVFGIVTVSVVITPISVGVVSVSVGVTSI